MENGKNLTSTVENTETITKASICIFVLIVSLIENIMVLVILKKNPKGGIRSANSLFIANMSVADVLFALQNIPHSYNYFVLSGRWIIHGNAGVVLCKIDIFLSLIAMVTGNLTILAIAAYRVFGVYCPLKKIITRKVCFFIIFLTWLIPTLFASPMLFYADLMGDKDFTTCSLTDVEVMKIWYAVLAGIFATTLVAMLALYTAIGVKLWRRKFPDVTGDVRQRAELRREKRNRDIFKMLITLVVTFYVCSLPIIILQLSLAFGFYEVIQVHHGLFIATFLLFLNGVINPMIYFKFNKRFRDVFKGFLPKCICPRVVVYSVAKNFGRTGATDRHVVRMAAGII